ncbi:MAG: hypothetical protein Q8L41_15180 [Anaerolineales bacterium]|nr:hypothetical protein [Anaerolineales bacterium]
MGVVGKQVGEKNVACGRVACADHIQLGQGEEQLLSLVNESLLADSGQARQVQRLGGGPLTAGAAILLDAIDIHPRQRQDGQQDEQDQTEAKAGEDTHKRVSFLVSAANTVIPGKIKATSANPELERLPIFALFIIPPVLKSSGDQKTNQ